jgi:hypothetical protein
MNPKIVYSSRLWDTLEHKDGQKSQNMCLHEQASNAESDGLMDSVQVSGVNLLKPGRIK